VSAAVDLLELPQGVELVSFGDRRNPDAPRKVAYADSVRSLSCHNPVDVRPYDSDIDPPLTAETLVGNARFMLGPVLSDDGKVFCSPWCGFKCTKAAHDRAVLEADLLCKALGPGWTPEVWENTGWNYAAHMGGAKVTPNKNGSTLAGTYTVTGYTGWCNFGEKQTIERGATPREAIDAAKKAMDAVIAVLSTKLAEVA
jgi:hypothetical protein